jgi:hypothetical protein
MYGNQEKQRKEIRDGNPHASFQGRVLKIQRVKKENPCSTPVVVFSHFILGERQRLKNTKLP